jgi:hypothetical protein
VRVTCLVLYLGSCSISMGAVFLAAPAALVSSLICAILAAPNLFCALFASATAAAAARFCLFGLSSSSFHR